MDTYHKDVWVPWAAMIKERTTAIGKPVEIVIYPSEALVKHADQYQAVIAGVADICANIVVTQYVPDGGLLSVMDLPFILSSATVGGQVAQELYDKHPEIQKETAKVKLLWFQQTGLGFLSSRSKSIKTVEDFKGVKIRANRTTSIDIVKALGGVPLDMFIPEIYSSLDRGILDAVCFQWESLLSFKFMEVTKYRTIFPRSLYSDILSVVMNWDTWNRLPPDVQKIFVELSGAYMSKFTGVAFDKSDATVRGIVLAYDKKVGNPEPYIVPADEVKKWDAALAPVYDKWIQRMEAKGLPGKAILADALSLGDKYSK
jgi:TRAP-type C4-dicarboxylate transport system substrate-binding protein